MARSSSTSQCGVLALTLFDAPRISCTRQRSHTAHSTQYSARLWVGVNNTDSTSHNETACTATTPTGTAEELCWLRPLHVRRQCRGNPHTPQTTLLLRVQALPKRRMVLSVSPSDASHVHRLNTVLGRQRRTRLGVSEHIAAEPRDTRMVDLHSAVVLRHSCVLTPLWIDCEIGCTETHFTKSSGSGE